MLRHQDITCFGVDVLFSLETFCFTLTPMHAEPEWRQGRIKDLLVTVLASCFRSRSWVSTAIVSG